MSFRSRKENVLIRITIFVTKNLMGNSAVAQSIDVAYTEAQKLSSSAQDGLLNLVILSSRSPLEQIMPTSMMT